MFITTQFHPQIHQGDVISKILAKKKMFSINLAHTLLNLKSIKAKFIALLSIIILLSECQNSREFWLFLMQNGSRWLEKGCIASLDVMVFIVPFY